MFFFFNAPATTEIYTLSLHDALPISISGCCGSRIATQWSPARRIGPNPSSWAQKDAFSPGDRKSTRLNSSHVEISYAVFCLKKKKKNKHPTLALQSPHSAVLTVHCPS